MKSFSLFLSDLASEIYCLVVLCALSVISLCGFVALMRLLSDVARALSRVIGVSEDVCGVACGAAIVIIALHGLRLYLRRVDRKLDLLAENPAPSRR